jgi:hypothetical protein
MFDHVKCVDGWMTLICHVYNPTYYKVMTIAICDMPSYTTQFGFCDQPLQLHTSQEGHMGLLPSELLNPCCFVHLVIKDV